MNTQTRLPLPVILGLAALTIFAITWSQMFSRPSPESRIEEEDQRYYDSLMDHADSLVTRAGQPRSASEFYGQIIERADKKGHVDWSIRARLQMTIVGQTYTEAPRTAVLDTLRQMLGKAEFPARNILHATYAAALDQYYNENRWRIGQRTEIQNDTSTAIDTWSADRLYNESLRQYALALRDSTELLGVRARDLLAIIDTMANGQLRRPTLYDILANHKIEFLESKLNSWAKPADYTTPSRPEALAARKNFERADFSGAGPFNALMRTYQQLLRAHASDCAECADAYDLKRLRLAHQFLATGNKDALYMQRLAELGATAESDVASLALAAKAEMHKGQENDKVAAVAICERVLRFMPDSPGADRCRALLRSIKAVQLNVSVPYQVEPDKNFPLKIDYSNLNSVYARVMRLDFGAMRTFLLRSHVAPLRTGQTVRSWTIPLVDFDDYQRHSIETVMESLPLGSYVVELSERSDFLADSGLVVQAGIFASRLGWMQLGAANSAGVLRTVDAGSGKTKGDVRVKLYRFEYDRVARRSMPFEAMSGRSDSEGEIDLGALPMNNSYALELFSGSDSLWHGSRSINGGREYRKAKESITTEIFTDRAIYRPGQPIYFKGISYVNKRAEGDKQAAAEREETVVFSDVNGRELGKLELETNQFGSFTGSFVAPSGLTGVHSIRTDHGYKNIRIEEYKRPRFEVEILPSDSSWKLNKDVKIFGKASGLAGYDVADAQVEFTVERLPIWRPWYGYYSSYRRSSMPSESAQVIAVGSTRTDSAGAFTLDFVAEASEARIAADPNLAYRYRIEVKVTDPAGETRTAESDVKIGARTLELRSTLPAEVNIRDLKQFKVFANNLGGRAVAARGTVIIEELQPPKSVMRAPLWQPADTSLLARAEYHQLLPLDAYLAELDPAGWPVRREVLKQDFSSEPNAAASFDLPQMPPGVYRVSMFSTDKFGRAVETRRLTTVFDMFADEVLAHQPFDMHIEKMGLEPGDTLRVSVGSAYADMPVTVRLTFREDVLLTRELMLNKDQQLIEFPVKAVHRGGIQVQVIAAREYRAYQRRQNVRVNWSNKRLDLKLASYRDKTRPGAEEEWRLTIAGPDGEAVAAELLAAMYDASLDEFVGHNWGSIRAGNSGESIFNWRNFPASENLKLVLKDFNVAREHQFNFLNQPYYGAWGGLPADRLRELVASPRIAFARNRGVGGMAMELNGKAAPANVALSENAVNGLAVAADGAHEIVQYAGSATASADDSADDESPESTSSQKRSATPQVRRDFRETAFFMPQVRTNADGQYVLSFSMPDALTRWRFMALAHTPQMQADYLETEIVTQKELMLLPNMPRFLRAGDEIELPVQVRNMLNTPAAGSAGIRLTNALTGADLQSIILGDVKRELELPAKGAATAVWRIKVPQGVEVISYYLEASTAAFSDAEENVIPVLPNRRLVTETLAMSVRAGVRKSFELPNLLEADKSSTLKHRSLSFELTLNPTWYVVQALPYLIEYPYDCSEQLYSRLFANAVAGKILADNPRIKQVMDQWRAEDRQLLSPLQRNQDLKSVLLEATPWLFDGLNQTEQMRRVSLLMDVQQLRDGLAGTAAKLAERQSSDGSWPWFAGGRADTYITAYITSGIGQLLKMQAVEDKLTLVKLRGMYNAGLRFLDDEYSRRHKNLIARKNFDPEDNYLSAGAVLYMFARSFEPGSRPSSQARASYAFWLKQAQDHWLKQSVMTQSMIGLVFHRADESDIAKTIVNSLRERAVRSDEFGMYWKNQRAWLWYNSKIESQALAIDLFREVAQDRAAVAEMQMWLLQRKRTTHWGNTRATALACYAVLQGGADMLIEQGQADVKFGGRAFEPDADATALAGLGYVRADWSGVEINSSQGEVEIYNKGKTLNWAGMYWQYYEDLDKIPAATGSDDAPLSVNKRLFVRVKSADGETLRPVDADTGLKVGETLVVRLEVRCDREMEYLHLQDMRGAGFEPRDVLSGYRRQGGLSYYMSVRDASVNFFISRMRPGTYVLEYDLHVAHRGTFSNGISTVQSMYAPEFAGHTAGDILQVR